MIFRNKIMLNPDLHNDLAYEFILLGEKYPNLTTKFMLSGNTLLSSLKKVASKVNTIYFQSSWNNSFNNHSSYMMDLKWVSL